MDSYNKKVKSSDSYIINIKSINPVSKRYRNIYRENVYYNPCDSLLKYLGLYRHKCTFCLAGNCIVKGAR